MSPKDIPTEWPSIYLSEATVRERIDKIHALYIHADADSQICLPYDVLQRTERRIQLVHLYGPETFEESLKDPIKTMKRDILPRFLRSSFFTEMMSRLHSVETLPPATELEFPEPPNTLQFASIDEVPSSRKFHLSEIVENRYLYQKFLLYLQKCFCAENLVCYRLVTLFEEMCDAKQTRRVSDIAWTIYRFFVAEGAAYEISIEFSERKAIMLQLAKPKINTFEFVKKSSYSMLKTIYASYKTTPEYQDLAHYVRTKYSHGPFDGCFFRKANQKGS